MAGRKKAAKSVPEKPSEDPEALRQQHTENIRKASDALRALQLANDVEPCVVFKP